MAGEGREELQHPLVGAACLAGQRPADGVAEMEVADAHGVRVAERPEARTVGTDTPSSSASVTWAAPSAARRMILARIAVRCSVVPARVMARRATASDSLAASGGAG